MSVMSVVTTVPQVTTAAVAGAAGTASSDIMNAAPSKPRRVRECEPFVMAFPFGALRAQHSRPDAHVECGCASDAQQAIGTWSGRSRRRRAPNSPSTGRTTPARRAPNPSAKASSPSHARLRSAVGRRGDGLPRRGLDATTRQAAAARTRISCASLLSRPCRFDPGHRSGSPAPPVANADCTGRWPGPAFPDAHADDCHRGRRHSPGTQLAGSGAHLFPRGPAARHGGDGRGLGRRRRGAARHEDSARRQPPRARPQRLAGHILDPADGRRRHGPAASPRRRRSTWSATPWVGWWPASTPPSSRDWSGGSSWRTSASSIHVRPRLPETRGRRCRSTGAWWSRCDPRSTTPTPGRRDVVARIAAPALVIGGGPSTPYPRRTSPSSSAPFPTVGSSPWTPATWCTRRDLTSSPITSWRSSTVSGLLAPQDAHRPKITTALAIAPTNNPVASVAEARLNAVCRAATSRMLRPVPR